MPSTLTGEAKKTRGGKPRHVISACRIAHSRCQTLRERLPNYRCDATGPSRTYVDYLVFFGCVGVGVQFLEPSVQALVQGFPLLHPELPSSETFFFIPP
ncbi:hypothetical protein ACCAA_920019 [Candidatus Accumulibacter aalborgensis]|uniref:Uncharacterized protein n=1 Tax=Candidatus Accumulibacter aalborgensis TaxID=1860102 RepID=A0A1A8Y1I0_9PROT|nr:hypothetical protein ACCAA_920019 [Candidatus Accumulibacter aalborgensis]